MPLRNGYTYTYGRPSAGVNFYSDLHAMRKDESPYMGNCYYRNGVAGRFGMKRFSSVEVTASKALTALHKFYYGMNNRQLLAASGANVKWYDSASDKWETIIGGWVDGELVTFATWGPKNAVYIANGNDQAIKWVGNRNEPLLGAPAKVRQFLPLLDRMLTIDNTDPSFLRWTLAYSDSQWVAAQNAAKVPGPGRIEGITYHGLQTQTGFSTKALLFKGSSTWLFTANDLTPASLDARLDIISPNIGTSAWRTAVSTPIGTIFLANDRQIYLITVDAQLIPIGTKLKSGRQEISGIESIPMTWIQKAFAIYHDNFYKLFIPASGGTFNTIQYWLDINRFSKDYAGFYGPWFGPMTGQSISHAIVQDGPGDDGALIGGEADSSIGSYVYSMDSGYVDVNSAIRFLYLTNYDPHGAPELYKAIGQVDLECANTEGDLVVSAFDTISSDVQEKTNSLSSTAIFWGSKFWGESYWSNAWEMRRLQSIPSEKVQARRLAIQLDFSSATERMIVSNIAIEGQVRSRKTFIGAKARI